MFNLNLFGRFKDERESTLFIVPSYFSLNSKKVLSFFLTYESFSIHFISFRNYLKDKKILFGKAFLVYSFRLNSNNPWWFPMNSGVLLHSNCEIDSSD